MWNPFHVADASAYGHYDARAEQPDASDSPDLSPLLEKLAQVRADIVASRPMYEYTGARTLGGVPSATPYQMPNPFDSDCEACVLAVVNTANTATTLALSDNPNPPGISTASAGLTNTLQGDFKLLYVASLPANTTVAAGDNWFPLQSGAFVYVTVGSASTSGAYVVLQFRRRINPAGVPNFGF